MKSATQTICLSMIVKNEAHVIRRCLDSVRPIIHHWVIVDTGSTDGTQEVIRSAMADVPGMLVERPWVDFAYNRSEALRLARARGHYSLIIDADDELVIPAGFTMPKLEAPSYNFVILDSFTRYERIQMVSNALPWRYRGVLHEFLHCEVDARRASLPLAMRRGDDGARHRDPDTYKRDATILAQALTTERDPFLIARYTFYLAQSYRDTNDLENALKYYLQRAEYGFWHEEVYISLLSAAYIMEAFREPEDKIKAVYDRAITICPERAEARHGASRYYRHLRKFVEGFYYAEAGLPPRMPSEGLFIQPWIYQYGLRDEYAVNAYCTGQYRACLANCLEILEKPELPIDVRERIAKLSREALDKMLDPVWGFAPAAYRTEFMPQWQL